MSALAEVIAKLSSFSSEELATVQAMCKVLLGERDKKKRPPAAARGPAKKKPVKPRPHRDVDGDGWIME